MKRYGSSAIVVVLSSVLSGCIGMRFADLWSSYSEQVRPIRLQLQLGQYREAAASVPDSQPSDNNYLLDRLEVGRIGLLAGDWSGSEQAFSAASSRLDWLDQQAQYRISHGLEQASALFSNDQAISYLPPDYEQALLHHYQALNYLFLNKDDDALVELRKANQVQERALARRDDALQKAREEAELAGVSSLVEQATSNLPQTQTAIGKFKGKVQSLYTIYLSALLYEAKGDLNDAYVDYRRAQELLPDNPLLQQDLVRLSGRLGLLDEQKKFRERFALPKQAMPGPSSGQLVILSEQGLIPQLQEVYLPVPLISSNGQFKSFTLALPWYPTNASTPTVGSLQLDGTDEPFSVLMSFNELAAYSLQERLPGIVTRQILRLGTKELMRHEASKRGGDIGGLLVGVYNMLSEHADTRSWSTLPANVMLWRRELAEGEHSLRVGAGDNQQILTVPVVKNKITLVWVQQSGGRPVAVIRQIA